MTKKDEASLLLFLETQIVDHWCKVDIRHMNVDDMKMAKRWDREKYITFGHLHMKYINKCGKRIETYGVKFSEAAWADAHRYRRERGDRISKRIDVLSMLCGDRAKSKPQKVR